MSKNRSKNSKKWGMAAGRVKHSLPFYFIVAVAKRYNTQKVDSQLPNAEKTDFLRHFFFLRLHSRKKKTLTSLVNYSTLLPFTGITFQDKGKVLDTLQLIDITTRVLPPNQL